MADLDMAAVQAWVDLAYPRGTGTFVVGREAADGSWRQWEGLSRDRVAQTVQDAEGGTPRGIYLSACTFTGSSRKVADARQLFGVWSDIDIDGPGHKHDPAKDGGRPLPPDEQAARKIVSSSGLPEPTAWTHSGGGLYAWWLLDSPAEAAAHADLVARWQAILSRSAKDLGWHYGTGIGDLARVLRVPGTVNRKEGLSRPCRLLSSDGPRYTIEQLRKLADALAPPPPPKPAKPPVRRDGLTPWDDFNARASWPDVLVPHGWRLVHTEDSTDYWRHPNATARWSASTNHEGTDRLKCFTDNPAVPIPTDGTHSKAFVWAALRQGSDAPDLAAAARELAALGYGDQATIARQVDEWIAGITGVKEASFTGAPDIVESSEPVKPAPLVFLTVRELRARVAAAGPQRYLLRGYWPGGDYGVHAGDAKAQKTWNTVDVAVSVASATPWLGLVPVDLSGPVLMFAGEGGEADLLRRIDAVATARGLCADDLPIVICCRAPHLSDAVHLGLMADKLDAVRPVLVTLDPLYLAARGAELGNLYAMGALLENPQHMCQAVGSGLWVATHQNRKEGRGPSRITGAGPAEWGRVLISAAVMSRHLDPVTRETTVITELDAIGGTIAGGTIRVTRRVRSREPDDLDSPLHYAVAASEQDGPGGEVNSGSEQKMPPARAKLLAALEYFAGDPRTTSQLIDQVAATHGHGLKRETASRELNALVRDNHADRADPLHRGGEASWWAITPGQPA